MEPLSVQVNGRTVQIKNADQIAALRDAGVLNEQDAVKLQEQLKPKEQPKTDEVKVEHKPATDEDKAKAEGSRKAQSDATARAANAKYFGEESLKLPTKELRGFLYGMTEAANDGDYKKAAEYYLKLEQVGVFAEETGVQKPPFAEQMEEAANAIRQEHAAELQRQATAENVVRGVNSREGMADLIEAYDKIDDKKEVKEELGVTGRGAGKVAKNARKNSEHIQRQLALKEVYIEGQTYDGKSADEVAKDRKSTLDDEFKTASKDKDAKPAGPQVQVMSKEGANVAKLLNERAKKMGVSFMEVDADGNIKSIDIDKAQSVARGIVSIAGDRGDKNELAAVAQELDVKEKDVKAFLRGLNIDYKKDKTWLAHLLGGVAGAGAAAASLFAPFMNSPVTAAISTIVPGAVNATIDKTITNNNHEVTGQGPGGQNYYDKIEESLTTVTTTYTTTPDSVKTENVKMKSKKGFGDYLKAAALGYAVYDLTQKGLKAVFNKDPHILKKGASLADALEDPSLMKKKHNQELMTYIKNFKIEGYDEATQRQIKLALMEEAMGNNGTGKLNDRELVGIAAALKSIPPKKDDTTTPDITTPDITTPDITTPVTTTVTRDYGIDETKIDNPTYDVKSGDNPAGMIFAFYGVPYNRKPGSAFQKLYTAWAAENNYKKGDNMVVGTKLVFPPITLDDGTTYEADMSKDPTKGKVVKNNRGRSGGGGKTQRAGYQGYEKTNTKKSDEEEATTERTWTGPARDTRPQAQGDIEQQRRKRAEEDKK